MGWKASEGGKEGVRSPATYLEEGDALVVVHPLHYLLEPALRPSLPHPQLLLQRGRELREAPGGVSPEGT